MKRSSITAVNANVSLAENMIEEHINSMYHREKNIDENILSEKFETINWCSDFSPVEGTIEISLFNERKLVARQVSIPVSTRFMVVCTKGKNRNYKITWSCSLS